MAADIDLIAWSESALYYVFFFRSSERTKEGSALLFVLMKEERGGQTLFKLGNLSGRLRLRFR